MKRIGLTGGIGSGKSTVANFFSELGVPVIDADQSARTILHQDTTLLKHIQQYFGASVFLVDQQTLDRRALRERIFSHPEDKKWLEDLLHPSIYRDIDEQVCKLKDQAYCIIMVPLLFEKMAPEQFDRIAVVVADEALRRKRILQRDAISTTLIETIFAQQLPEATTRSLAHDIIDNNGDLAALAQTVQRLHRDVYSVVN